MCCILVGVYINSLLTTWLYYVSLPVLLNVVCLFCVFMSEVSRQIPIPINHFEMKKQQSRSQFLLAGLPFQTWNYFYQIHQIEIFYLNTMIEQLFLFVEQLEVCLPYSRLLTGIPILAVFQNLRWNSNKTSLCQAKFEKHFV